jgi:hypothetical protein
MRTPRAATHVTETEFNWLDDLELELVEDEREVRCEIMRQGTALSTDETMSGSVSIPYWRDPPPPPSRFGRARKRIP